MVHDGFCYYYYYLLCLVHNDLKYIYIYKYCYILSNYFNKKLGTKKKKNQFSAMNINRKIKSLNVKRKRKINFIEN